MYQVTLLKKPVVNDYRSDYFPRRFRYKADADKLVAEVDAKGGVAQVSRVNRVYIPDGNKYP